MTQKLKDPEKHRQIKAAQRLQRKQHLRAGTASLRQLMAFTLAKLVTKRAGKEIELTDLNTDGLVDLWTVQNGLCAISGLALGRRIDCIDTVSIDRKDNNGPYSLTNVQLVCKWINLGKNKYSDEEMRLVLDQIRGQVQEAFSASSN